MSAQIPVTLISPSVNPATPSYIEVFGDHTPIFHGKEWINAAGTRVPFYTYDNDSTTATPSVPAGYTVLVATTFELTGNVKYAGKYTVYTKPLGGLSSSSYDGTYTRIYVNEALATDGVGTELSTGNIENVSTYRFKIFGEADQIVVEQSSAETRPLEIVGKFSTGWGEVMQQNMLLVAQSFAGTTAPVNPYYGQLWFDTVNQKLKIYTLSNTFSEVNFDGGTYRAAIPAPGGAGPVYTWNVTHNLGLSAPFVCSVDFFIDVGGGVHEMILPNTVTFNANSLTATFSSNYSGRVIVRA